MKTRLQSNTRLQCPECRMELMPDSSHKDHVTCGRCGREIYLDLSKYEKVHCPKCEEAISENKGEVNLGECCCP